MTVTAERSSANLQRSLGDPAISYPTEAYSIVSPVSGYRGVVAVEESGGQVLELGDRQLGSAHRELAGAGLWTELSSAAGLLGLRAVGPLDDLEGPVVCISTSSGFKNLGLGSRATETVTPEWDEVHRRLRAAGIAL
ncbi:hypothetical protein JK359_02460 [Streptomyces actinomycinicus]|uniref:Pyridoxal-phosphate dependent enzyme n=1 Tax=Streptomyces actinomycinicus TaxID=1695166 RepID=A0A937JL08_9ACTN|nr:hypothetical protein [Streptomyces actinomycinicus]MBL1080846.1 hypothetical protein [Streptomyces actinomycinicus]